jgi:uncharacterized protein YcsI (UPF0317 family)
VGGSIVVFNLDTKQVKWTVELDLSTDSVSYRAYIYSSPTVVDVDEDGFLEIVVGTSFGFLYVLHHNGIASFHLWIVPMYQLYTQITSMTLQFSGSSLFLEHNVTLS